MFSCFLLTRLNVLTHFWPMFPFFTPWKHQKTKRFVAENQTFSGVFWDYKMGTLTSNGLIHKKKQKKKQDFSNKRTDICWLTSLQKFKTFHALIFHKTYKNLIMGHFRGEGSCFQNPKITPLYLKNLILGSIQTSPDTNTSKQDFSQ